MADPLSITASILTLVQVSVQVTVLLKQFRDESSAVDVTLSGLLNDVEGFQHVLESMKETFEQNDIKTTLQVTGHVGNHWKNLARSLKDGDRTLRQLKGLLEGVNKTVSFLDRPRKQLRFKSAVGQIACYREQIRSYRAALQLSLSTVILWNQVAFQKSTERILEQILPSLDKLFDEVRRLGAELNAKIKKLQALAPNQIDPQELDSMSNLRECVRSAADVISTTSTALTAGPHDRVTVVNDSDFGDIFPNPANDMVAMWIQSNTVHEQQDALTPLPLLSESGHGEDPIEYPSDSDSDIENEMIRALFSDGKERKEQGDLPAAVRRFKNCLSRISSISGSTVPQDTTSSGVSKSELLELLTETYCSLRSWGSAKLTMQEKLQVTERRLGNKDAPYLWDTLKLAEILMNNAESLDAHLQARRSLRGFKKLGEPGYAGYEHSLQLLIRLCRDEGTDEEEGYAVLLLNHQARMKRSSLEFGVAPGAVVVSPKSSVVEAERQTSSLDEQAALSSLKPDPKPGSKSALDPKQTLDPSPKFFLSRQWHVMKKKKAVSHLVQSPTISLKDPSNSWSSDETYEKPKSSTSVPPSEDSESSVTKSFHSRIPSPEVLSLPSYRTSTGSTRLYSFEKIPGTLPSWPQKSTNELPVEPGDSLRHLPSPPQGNSITRRPRKSHDTSKIAGSGIVQRRANGDEDGLLEGAQISGGARRRPVNKVFQPRSHQLLRPYFESDLKAVESPRQAQQRAPDVSPHSTASRVPHCHSTGMEDLEREDKLSQISLRQLSREAASLRTIPLTPAHVHANRPKDKEDLNWEKKPQIPIRFLSRKDASLETVPLAPMPSNFDQGINRKFVLFGDAKCGKTWLAVSYCTSARGRADLSTYARNNVRDYKMTGPGARIVVEHKTPAIRGYGFFPPGAVHALFLCFDFANADSLYFLKRCWDLRPQHCENIPIILVGCKNDLRKLTRMEALRAELRPSRFGMAVDTNDVKAFERKIKARGYFETSALERTGVQELFNFAIDIS